MIPASEVLAIVGGVVLPSAAIIISTLVAIKLSATERRAAAQARLEERAQVVADKREDRIEEAYVRALTVLASLNTIDLRTEPLAEPLRELRLSLTLLASYVDDESRVFDEWLDVERLLGLQRGSEVFERAQAPGNQPPGAVFIAAYTPAPFHLWARDFASNLRAWRAGNTRSADLIEQVRLVRAQLKIS